MDQKWFTKHYKKLRIEQHEPHLNWKMNLRRLFVTK